MGVFVVSAAFVVPLFVFVMIVLLSNFLSPMLLLLSLLLTQELMLKKG